MVEDGGWVSHLKEYFEAGRLAMGLYREARDVLPTEEKRKELDQQVTPIADILVPIFFVTVGAKADLGVLNPAVSENREGLIIAAFLITVAIIGKVVTGWSFVGQPDVNRLAIGVGMIPRGEVGLVFAGIGSASGVLDKPLEAAIIVMVILTTFLAPPLLQFALKGREATTLTADASLPAVEEVSLKA